MKDFLENTIKKLVDKPKEAFVEEFIDENGQVFLTIHVSPQDMGKIIGREGKIISSLRNLVKIIATKEQKMVSVDLAETVTN